MFPGFYPPMFSSTNILFISEMINTKLLSQRPRCFSVYIWQKKRGTITFSGTNGYPLSIKKDEEQTAPFCLEREFRFIFQTSGNEFLNEAIINKRTASEYNYYT